jgi:oxygen-independent coproporphyrinogen-3 oxidase
VTPDRHNKGWLCPLTIPELSSDPSAALGLYIHIPFCEKKCPYCDFNTYAGLQPLYQETVDALCMEMARWAEPLQQRTITSIFLGGGTPTVLAEGQLAQIFATVQRFFALADDCEITSEANPGTVDRAKFVLLRELGVNRLSLGVQSFQPDELQFLGRIHNVDDVYRAVDAAHSAGFDNINLDFIFGLPHQAPKSWGGTLQRALSLRPEHLSLYSLIVEPNTPLQNWVSSGRVDAPDDDLAADLYETAMSTLAEAGYWQYEVSNWALRHDQEDQPHMPARACRHNLLYWRNAEYLGIGPGAHSHLRSRSPAGQIVGRRWGNRKPVAGYTRRIRQGEEVTEFEEVIGDRLAMGETMMLGLRLIDEGVAFDRFQTLHAADLRTLFGGEMVDLQRSALLQLDDERVRLTPKGLMVGNRVFARFLPDET